MKFVAESNRASEPANNVCITSIGWRDTAARDRFLAHPARSTRFLGGVSGRRAELVSQYVLQFSGIGILPPTCVEGPPKEVGWAAFTVESAQLPGPSHITETDGTGRSVVHLISVVCHAFN